MSIVWFSQFIRKSLQLLEFEFTFYNLHDYGFLTILFVWFGITLYYNWYYVPLILKLLLLYVGHTKTDTEYDTDQRGFECGSELGTKCNMLK